MHSTQMFHLPELVEKVVSFFEVDGDEHWKENSLAACTQVSRAWRQVFIPFYWYHINDTTKSRLGRTFKSLWFNDMKGYSVHQSREESQGRRAYLRQFLHHVRQLHVSFPWTVDLFLEWSITHQCSNELLVLSFNLARNAQQCFTKSNDPTSTTGSMAGIFAPESHEAAGEEKDAAEMSSFIDGSLSLQEREALLSRVPRWAFKEPRYSSRFPEQLRFSQAIWQFIQSSPKLTLLEFDPRIEDFMWTPDLCSSGGSDGTARDPRVPSVKSAGALLLVCVLKSHKNLYHFKSHPWYSDEVVLLEVMAQEQRRGCSTVRSYSSMYSSFIVPVDQATRNLLRDRLLNTGMRCLNLGSQSARSTRARFFLEVFPNLEELHLKAVNRDQEESNRETLVNTSLRKLSIGNKSFGLLACRIRFEGLKEFEALRMGREIWDLVHLLRWSMPQCESFHAGASGSWRRTQTILSNSIPSDIQTLYRHVSSPKEMELPVRDLSLILDPYQTMPEILGQIRWMPFLTNVEFQGNSGAEVLGTLARHCPRLQRLNVLGMRGLSSRAICLILRSCKDLKSIKGPDMIIRAIDVIQSQPWVCSGMQEFSCQIISVPRLTADEEKDLSQSDMGLEEVRLEEAAERAIWEQDGGGAVERGEKKEEIEGDKELDDPRVQRKQRIRQLYLRRRLLVFQQRSREIQNQIYSILAKWTQLEVLDVSRRCSDYKRTRISRHRPYGLEWSFDSGLEQLVTLKKLESAYVDPYDHRAGEDERQWMKDNWPQLKGGPLVDST